MCNMEDLQMGISRYPLNNDESNTLGAKLLYVTYSKYENDWPSIAHSHFLQNFVTSKVERVFI